MGVKKLSGGIVMSLLSLMFVSCNIDDSYDLSGAIDNSNIGIGTEETTFDLPLLDVKISMSQLLNSAAVDMSSVDSRASVSSSSSSSAVEMLEVIDNISTLLPSNLEGDYAGGIDIDKLDDADYTTGLVDLLFDELASNEEKRVLFVEMAMEEKEDGESSAYVEQLEIAIGADLNSFSDVNSCADAVEDLLNSNDSDIIELVDSLKSEVTATIVDKSEGIESEFVVYESIDDEINIGDDVFDMIEKNLDGYKNTLSLLSQVTSNLPFDIKITPVIILSNGDAIKIADIEDMASEATSLTSDQFRELLSGMTFTAVIEINNYDSSVGILNFDDMYVYVKLIARKSGSLSLDF